MSTVEIISTASYLPPTIVSNDDLSKLVDTTDEWITTRTGIKNRRFAEEESNVDMATKAAQKALTQSGINPFDLCCCLVASFTPDNVTPSIACDVHRRLSLPKEVMAFDINAACSGFVYGLKIANALLAQTPNKYLLFICSEKVTNYLDMNDRTTCVLFGDGAAAVVLRNNETSNMYSSFGTIGHETAIICKSRPDKATSSIPYLHMDGKAVFRFAVATIQHTIKDLLEQANLTIDQIDHIVCHQANMRIIAHVYKKMTIPPEKFYMNVQEYGNTSAASIPIALNEMNEKNLLKKGEKILCIGFGAGLTWGGVLITW